jgi:hypothetical protein
MDSHQLLRRGLPFERHEPGERGLLFLPISFIERQFEFITRAWLNSPHLRSVGRRPDRRPASYAVAGTAPTPLLPYREHTRTPRRP